MQTIGALALGGVDVAFFGPPPHRPRGTDGREGRGRRLAGQLVKAVRRRLHAGARPTRGQLPVDGTRNPH